MMMARSSPDTTLLDILAATGVSFAERDAERESAVHDNPPAALSAVTPHLSAADSVGFLAAASSAHNANTHLASKADDRPVFWPDSADTQPQPNLAGQPGDGEGSGETDRGMDAEEEEEEEGSDDLTRSRDLEISRWRNMEKGDMVHLDGRFLLGNGGMFKVIAVHPSGRFDARPAIGGPGQRNIPADAGRHPPACPALPPLRAPMAAIAQHPTSFY